MDFKADFEPEEPTLMRKGLRCFWSRRPHPLWSSLPWRDPHAQTGARRPASPPHSPWHQERPSAAMRADMGLAQAGATLQSHSSAGAWHWGPRCWVESAGGKHAHGQLPQPDPPLQTPGLWSKVPITRQRLNFSPGAMAPVRPVWRVLCSVCTGRDEGEACAPGSHPPPLCIRLQTDWRTPSHGQVTGENSSLRAVTPRVQTVTRRGSQWQW